MTKLFAIINNNKVSKVVIAEEATHTEGVWIDLTGIVPQPWIGWAYQEGIFTPPLVILPNVITKLALLDRMTDAEFSSILAAAKTDTDVEAWKTRFDAATSIDLDSDRTKTGFTMLYLKALLTEARATAILTDPVQPAERP